jgi:hypothetical protein
MHLTLTPQIGLPGQRETALRVTGDMLRIDETEYDLSPIPEGGEAVVLGGPFVGPVTRREGILQVHLIVHLDHSAAPDQEGPWAISPAAGAVILPVKRRSPYQEVA